MCISRHGVGDITHLFFLELLLTSSKKLRLLLVPLFIQEYQGALAYYYSTANGGHVTTTAWIVQEQKRNSLGNHGGWVG